MPRTSQLGRAVLGAEAEWADQEELLAAIVDALGQTNYLLGRAHFPKQSPSRPPKPVPRPGQQADEELFVAEGDEPVSPEELREFLKNPL